MFSTQVSQIPIGLIEPHPKFTIRRTYKIDELVESIKTQGQMQPGRVIPRPDQKGYWLYIGFRRYYAVKKLYDEAKTEEEKKRFSIFYAFVDVDVTEEDMIIRALDENRTGIRMDLTPLEEALAIKRFKIVKLLDDRYRFLSRLRFTAEQLENLTKIEAAADYIFKLPVLRFLDDVLGRTHDERDLYMTAAHIAEYRYDKNVSKMEDSFNFREEMIGYEWFKKLFPDIVEQKEKEQETGSSIIRELERDIEAGRFKPEDFEIGTPSEPSREPGAETLEEKAEPAKAEATAPEKEPTQMPEYFKRFPHSITVDKAVLIKCPWCDVKTAFGIEKAEWEGKVISIKGRSPLEIEMETLVGQSPELECENCGKRYHILIKEEEGRIYTSTVKKKETIGPNTPAPTRFLVWNLEEMCWHVLDTQTGEIVEKIQVQQ